VVPVVIRGSGPYRFILDTGSSHTVISHALAASLGAVAVAKAPFATSAGAIMTPVVSLQDVSVGSVRVDVLLATSLPAEAADLLGAGISGIVGQDFLSQFEYTLDYRRSQLVWEDGQAGNGVPLALESSHGRFLVHLPQDPRCHCPVRLIPDSGANGLVLFSGTDADRLPVKSQDTPLDLSTLVGDRNARRVTVKALLVGPATLWNLSGAKVTLPQNTAEEGDGLLPLSLFASVSFHHRGGYMTVEPR
jgi:predicted aspartyl protease